MKIIFAGTPEFAVPALQGLIDAGFDVVAVLTQPDRPAGRGMQLKASPIKQLALQHNLRVLQPESLKPAPEGMEDVQAEIAALQADVLIVAAYGLIIPNAVLEMFAKGSYNIHGSLLPRWRGAAPIHRAILAGDAETGVTIMKVVFKLDAGDMISKFALPIQQTDTTQTLHDAISAEGAKLMVQAMHDLAKNRSLPAEPQDEALVTYAHKLEKTESPIDWAKSAVEISRQVRAFNPFPVATAQFRGEVVKIWFARSWAGSAQKGQFLGLASEVLAEITPRKINARSLSHANADGSELVVACGEGLLLISELQMPGGKRLSAAQFMQSQKPQVGEFFS